MVQEEVNLLGKNALSGESEPVSQPGYQNLV